MTAVFKKDFTSLFHGFIGWLFLAVMWGILSLYIGMSSFIGLDPDITAVLAVSSVIMIVMLPILSMRSFAEERKTRTDDVNRIPERKKAMQRLLLTISTSCRQRRGIQRAEPGRTGLMPRAVRSGATPSCPDRS